jgi:hypothetical protein
MKAPDNDEVRISKGEAGGPPAKTPFSPEVWKEVFRGNEFLRGLGPENIRILEAQDANQ